MSEFLTTLPLILFEGFNLGVKKMKKYLYALMLFVSYCNASTIEENLSTDKIYISSKDLLIGDNGIFINVNGQVIQVNELFHDEGGLYASSSLAPDLKFYYCDNCQKHHPYVRDDPNDKCLQNRKERNKNKEK